MYAKGLTITVFLIVLHNEISAAGIYFKRGDFDDPRLFSSAFGKRSSQLADKNFEDHFIQRRDDFDDPRFLTMAFGKRAILPTLDDFNRYAIYGKRSGDIDDPRFFSGAFGRK